MTDHHKFNYVQPLNREPASALNLKKKEDVIFLMENPGDKRVTHNEQLWSEVSLASGKLDMLQFLVDMRNSGATLNLAYNGSKGSDSNDAIIRTYTDYITQVNKSNYAFERFTVESGVCFDKLSTAVMDCFDVENLKQFKDNEKLFKKMFDKQMGIVESSFDFVLGSSKKLTTEAQSQADAYDTLGESVSTSLFAVNKNSNEAEEEKKQNLKLMQELQAREAKLNELKTGYDENVERLRKEYDDAKDAAEKAGDRELALQLTSMFTSVLSAGMGAYASTYHPFTINTGTGSKPDSKPDEPPTPNAEPSSPPSNGEAPMAEEEEVDSERLKDLTKKDAQADKDEALTIAELKDSEKKLKDQVEKQRQANQLMADEALLAAASASTEDLAKKADTFAKTAGSASEAAYAYQKEVSKTLYEAERARTKNNAELAELAKRLENSTDEDEVFKTCVLALNLATGALKSMKVLMIHFVQFWTSISNFVGDMGTSEIKSVFNNAYDKDESDTGSAVEMAIYFFSGEKFVLKSGKALLKWKALQTLMGYLNERSGDLVSKIEKDYKREFDNAGEARKYAAVLGEAMANDLNALEEESKEKGKIEGSGAEENNLKALAEENPAQ